MGLFSTGGNSISADCAELRAATLCWDFVRRYCVHASSFGSFSSVVVKSFVVN